MESLMQMDGVAIVSWEAQNHWFETRGVLKAIYSSFDTSQPKSCLVITVNADCVSYSLCLMDLCEGRG